VCENEGEYPEPLTAEWRRARKPHRCYACHEDIRKRDKYHIVVQIYDGEVETFRHCARCWVMASAIQSKTGYVQWDLHCGELWETAIGDVPHDIARLAFLTPDEAQRLPEVQG
jgi:hypothetical protein